MSAAAHIEPTQGLFFLSSQEVGNWISSASDRELWRAYEGSLQSARPPTTTDQAFGSYQVALIKRTVAGRAQYCLSSTIPVEVSLDEEPTQQGTAFCNLFSDPPSLCVNTNKGAYIFPARPVRMSAELKAMRLMPNPRGMHPQTYIFQNGMFLARVDL